MLRIVFPKGSLEAATLDLFDAADLAVTRSSDVDYRGVDRRSPRSTRSGSCARRRSRSTSLKGCSTSGSPGATGSRRPRPRWCRSASSEYSKASARPVRIVVAIGAESPIERVEDLPQGVRVATEYPGLTRRFFEKKGIDADIRLSYGATEAKVPEIADCIVDLTETGRALKAAGLKIIDSILTSHTELIANPVAYDDPAKRHAMGQLHTLLAGALEARGRVLLKLNVSDEAFERVIALVPSMKSPTISTPVRERRRLRGRDRRARRRRSTC